MTRRWQRRPSAQQLALLEHLLERSGEPVHGYAVTQATGLGPGTLYALLRRLHRDGHLKRSSRVVDGRNRVDYALTERGRAYAERALLEDVYERGAAAIALEADE